MKQKFKGIFPALLTPFKSDNTINEKALEELVKLNLNKGVSGFYVGGSTGEAFLLSIDERKYILELVASICKDKCVIISHVGAISTDQAITLAKHAQRVGVDAISAVAPFYYKFSFGEVKKYYYDIVQSVDLPMIIYNFPDFSGVTFDSENIKEFMENDSFIGMKHTSKDLYSFEQLSSKYPNKVFFNGFDEMFISGLVMGASGGIGSTYNFMAEKFIKIKKHFDCGEIELAMQEQVRANSIINILIKVGVFQGEKAILNMMGIDFGKCRRPFKPLTSEEIYLIENDIMPNLDVCILSKAN